MPWDPSEPNAIERLQIVYKIAERCNLNCSYCYYYNMGDDSALRRPARASLAATGALARWAAEGCRTLQIPKLLISFHGGEPMLMRSLEFARTCEIFVRHLAPAVELGFTVQTNGTLMTPGWLEALKRFNVHVGVSIDGRRADHDRFRLDHQGRSSFAETERCLERLMAESAAHPHLRPGTISVLHPAVDYAETYRYLRGLGVRSLHFLLPDRDAEGPREEVEPEARAIGRGLLDIFEAWLAEDDPSVRVRFIGETLGYFELTRAPGDRTRRRKTNQILVARSDGTVAVDDSLLPAVDWYRTTPAFAVAEHSLRDVLSDPIHLLLEEEGRRLPDDCAGCRWAEMCRGGDLENRYTAARGFNNRSIYCETYKTLYRGICELLVSNGYPRSEIAKRFGEAEVA